jgi:hypothetical protein
MHGQISRDDFSHHAGKKLQLPISPNSFPGKWLGITRRFRRPFGMVAAFLQTQPLTPPRRKDQHGERTAI